MSNLPLPSLGWAEGHAPVSRYVRALATALVASDNSPWTLEYPDQLADINTGPATEHIAILSTRPFAASTATHQLDDPTTTVPQLKRYLRIRKPAGTLTYVNLQIGTQYDSNWAPAGELSTDYTVFSTSGGLGYRVGNVMQITQTGIDSRDGTIGPLVFLITVTAVNPRDPNGDPTAVPPVPPDLTGPITAFTVMLDPATAAHPTQSYIQTSGGTNLQALRHPSDPFPASEFPPTNAARFSIIATAEYSPAYGGPTTNPVGSYLMPHASSVEVRWYWYRPNTLSNFPIDETVQVQYFMSFYAYTGSTADTYTDHSEMGSYLSMVQIGDPTVDTPNFTHYMISPAYVGSLEPYSSSDHPAAVNPAPDYEYNWFLTAGTFAPTFNAVPGFLNDPVSREPLAGFDKKYGNNTGMGNTDLIAIGTRYGVRYQAHHTSITTINPFMAKLFLSASQWTYKYHSSKIIVTHSTERERGMLQGTIIFDRSSIFNLDELYFNRGQDDERIYKTFLINAPGSFIGNSANVLYTIALLKFDRKNSPVDVTP